MSVVRFYSEEAVSGRALQRAAKLCPQLSVSTELCYNVELTGERPAACHVIIILMIGQVRFCKQFTPHASPLCPDGVVVVVYFLLSAADAQSLSTEQKEVLLWLFRPPLQTEPLSETSKLTDAPGSRLVEIGPRYQIKIQIIDPLCHSVKLQNLSERL